MSDIELLNGVYDTFDKRTTQLQDDLHSRTMLLLRDVSRLHSVVTVLVLSYLISMAMFSYTIINLKKEIAKIGSQHP